MLHDKLFVSLKKYFMLKFTQKRYLFFHIASHFINSLETVKVLFVILFHQHFILNEKRIIKFLSFMNSSLCFLFTVGVCIYRHIHVYIVMRNCIRLKSFSYFLLGSFFNSKRKVSLSILFLLILL